MRYKRFAILICLLFTVTSVYSELQIGDTAPEFALPGVDGRFHSLSDYADAEALAVIFTCPHCPFAQAFQGDMVRLQKEFGDKGVQILAINVNDEKDYPEDNYAGMKAQSSQNEYNFPYLRDRTQETAAAFGAEVTPHVFLFDRGRRLRYQGRIGDYDRESGKTTDADLRKALDALLSGKKIKTSTTRPIGCSIKWVNPGETPQTPFTIAKAAVPLAVGAKVPNAIVSDMSGKAVWLHDVLGGKPTALVVFRGGWCPFCMKHLAGLQQIYTELEKRGYQMIAISTDTPSGTLKGAEDLDLSYTLLSDMTMEASMVLGLAFEVDDETIERYKKYKIPLRSPPGSDRKVLPVPAVLIIDGDAMIRFVHTDPDYKKRLDPEAVLKNLSAGEAVTYNVDAKEYEGYLVNSSPKAPLVVLVHDWDGLTDYEVKRSDMLAKLGYNVLAIDMFGAGVRPTEISEKRRLTGELYDNREKMRRLLNAGIAVAKEQGVDTENAVIAGYCFGGTCVLELARSGAELKGFVGFHAGLTIPEGQNFEKTKGEVIIFHGTADKHVTMEHFAELGKALESAGVPHEMITYGGAPHAFSVFGSDRYRKEADTKSWSRFTDFLESVFK